MGKYTIRIAKIITLILTFYTLSGSAVASQESFLNHVFETDLEKIALQDFANIVNDAAGYDLLYVPPYSKCKFSMFYKGSLSEILQMAASTCDLDIEINGNRLFFRNKNLSKSTIGQYYPEKPNEYPPVVVKRTYQQSDALSNFRSDKIGPSRNYEKTSSGQVNTVGKNESNSWTVIITTIIISLVLSALMILSTFAIVRFLIFRRPLKTWTAIIISFFIWLSWHMIVNIYLQEPTNTSALVVLCIGGFFVLKYEKKSKEKATSFAHNETSPN